jgi:hypothetical protein
MDNITKGRNDLIAWENDKPKNFFTSDTNLQYILRHYMGDKAFETEKANLTQLGQDAATILDESAKIEDRIGNHPRVERWSDLGERTEQIEFHPNHDKTGRLIWQSGIMASQGQAGNNVLQMGLYYVICHNGEMGHLCSLACTSGLIRALQQAADDNIRQKFLPPLLNPDYDLMQHGAQFLTEIQGGSDVGSNAVIAKQADEGTWHISGEKWFCSNVNADQFLMTARATDKEGTRGLGLFVVPRQLEDETTNNFYIRRLKDKLGTRTLASAELDFQDAVAYPVGAIERGFKTVVELVLNTSRLMNAVACAGVMRRVYIEAGGYACHREAFGETIANFPMVQEALADIMSEYYAATTSSFYIAYLLDKIETGHASEDEKATYRMLVNINKYITSIMGTEIVHRGIEVLGGNGTIESFSILPRLYRDMVVLESWEGTHNVLCMQVMRDIEKYSIHESFIKDMTRHLGEVRHEDLIDSAASVHVALERMIHSLGKMQRGGMDYTQTHARRFVDLTTYIAQAALMLSEAQWELDNELPTFKPDIASYFINRHLKLDYDPMDDENYSDRLERLMMAL